MRKITFIYENPPIPIRSCDWRAVFTDDDENGPSGFGATKKEAFKDLLLNTEEEMAQYHHDTTWTVHTVDGKEVVVELDVRVEYNYEPASKVINVTEVKGLFRKHGKWITLDIPEELRVLALKHFDSSAEFQQEIETYRAEMAFDDAADAKADHIRERKSND